MANKTRNFLLITLLISSIIIAVLLVSGKTIKIPGFLTKSTPTKQPTIESKDLDVNLKLKLGSQGEEVKRLQEYLNENYDRNLEIDGIFGQETFNAFPTPYLIPIRLSNLGITV